MKILLTSLLAFFFSLHLSADISDSIKKEALNQAKPNVVNTFYKEGKYVMTIPVSEWLWDDEQKAALEQAKHMGVRFLKDYYLNLIEFYEIPLSEREKQNATVSDLHQLTKKSKFPTLGELIEESEPNVGGKKITELDELIDELNIEMEDLVEAYNNRPKDIFKDKEFGKDLPERLTPTGIIVQFPQVRISDAFTNKAANFIKNITSKAGQALGPLTYYLLKNDSINLTAVARPLKVVVYDFATQTYDTTILANIDLLAFVQKDIQKGSLANKRQKVKMRIGIGAIFGDLEHTANLSGFYTGVSYHHVSGITPNNLLNYPLNIKLGTFLPIASSYSYLSGESVAKNWFAIASYQRGVLSERSPSNVRFGSMNWNNGAVISFKKTAILYNNGKESIPDYFRESIEELESTGKTTLKDGTVITKDSLK